MATIFRGPLYSKHHRRPDPPSSITTVPNLLTTTLFVAAAAMPFSNAAALPSQVHHPSHQLSLNDDTSAGVPKTLTQDAVQPSFDPAHITPQHPRRAGQLNDDTSSGTPKTLFADAAKAAFNPPSVAPERARTSNADTSRGTFAALFTPVGTPFTPAPTLQVDGRRLIEVRSDVPVNLSLYFPPDLVAVAMPESQPVYRTPAVHANTSYRASALLDTITPAPFVNPPQWSPHRFWWQPADTSAGTPKPFIADAVSPQFNPPSIQVDRLRPVVDASQGSPRPLLDAVIPPFTAEPQSAPQRVWWQPEDTSTGTPKAFIPDAVVPQFNPPSLQADRLRPVADSSQGSPRSLLDAVVAPFVNAPQLTPDRNRAVADTSHGTPKVLYADAVAPFVNPPFLTADRVRPVVDTSQGLNLPLAFFVPPPPFFQTDWPAPIEYRRFQQHGWDQQANPDTIPPAIEVPPQGGVGGGGRPKRRYQIKLGERILEGSQEQIEALAREIALAEPATPDVVEIVVPAKKRKPALTAKTQLAADVLAAYAKAVADEQMRLLEIEDEEALIALLT